MHTSVHRSLPPSVTCPDMTGTADPALTPAQPVWVVAEDVLGRDGNRSDGMTGARPRWWKQDQAGMHPAIQGWPGPPTVGWIPANA